MNDLPELTQEYVRSFVMPAHGDLAKVQAMLADDPRLLDVMYEEWGETALGAASHVGNRPIAEYLLGQGAQLTIYAAAMLGRQAEVAAFLEADPTLVNSGGAHGISLLFHGALSGDLALLDFLVEKGNTQKAEGALHVAAARGDVALARWLLEHGADVTGRNFQEKTALEVAEANEQGAVAALLRDYGAVA
ncbi:MAG: ankyrin repeat domain-containing protein [Ardenticatenaceae bacterium]|nr:ankyrin repeat domain-containing protein [Ardenticatenaceae bacterium]